MEIKQAVAAWAEIIAELVIERDEAQAKVAQLTEENGLLRELVEAQQEKDADPVEVGNTA